MLRRSDDDDPMDDYVPFAKGRQWIGLLAFLIYLLIIIISTTLFWRNRRDVYIAVRSVNTTIIHVLVHFTLVGLVFPSRFIYPGVFPCAVELWSETILTPTLLLFLVAKLGAFVPEYQLSRRRLEASKSTPAVTSPLPGSEAFAALVAGTINSNLSRSIKTTTSTNEHISPDSDDHIEAIEVISINNAEITAMTDVKQTGEGNQACDGDSQNEIPDYYLTRWLTRKEKREVLPETTAGSQKLRRNAWASIRESVAWKLKWLLAPKTIFKLALIQAFVNIVILLSLQNVTTSYHIFPVVDYSMLCPKTMDSLPLFLETMIYILILEPLVLYLGRNVNDEFDLRIDVITSVTSGMSFFIAGIALAGSATVLPRSVRCITDTKLWVYAGALVSHCALVILPVARLAFRPSTSTSCDSCTTLKYQHQDNTKRFSCSYNSFNMVLNTPALFEQLKEFSVGTLSVENCLFIERVRQFQYHLAIGEHKTARNEMECLVRTFIEEGASCEVNILGCTRKKILASMMIMRSCTSPPPIQLFNGALQEVMELVYRDTFSAFHNKLFSC
ncbi:hypothetical protein SeMB42_g00887 [Synchytrium endobioticum]|uniref:RGS domain-containing protein n=1 Tax=Synchytrium endobioticum TaxID=286115 RepID=A0A507DLE7_9FUNG|nr:hypothetical protein SeLEV6574_g00098 [Synchytrium endobioticum]TPX53298.1 hypothetical protein SeMB42_g00887 [Synchytrium endobioticum]